MTDTLSRPIRNQGGPMASRQEEIKVLKSGEYHLGIDAPLMIPRLGPGSLGLRLDARKVHLEESGIPMILLVISERPGKA